MHHNNFGNFYTREIYAIAIPIGFIPIPIPIMSRMAIPIPMGFPCEWDSHGVSHSHAHLNTDSVRTFIRKKVMLVSKSTVDLRSCSRDTSDAGNVF